MKSFKATLLTLLCLTTINFVQGYTDGSRPSFVLWGDSITEFSVDPKLLGFQTLLAASYNRRVDIMNRGCSGYNTRDATVITSSLMKEFESHPPALVTIFFGANDAMYPPSPVHVSLQSYKENLKGMIQNIREHWGNTTKILLITPPPVDDKRIKDRGYDVTKTYAEGCITVGAERHVPVLNTFDSMSAIPDWQTLFRDGLHFNAAGNQIFHSMLLKAIQKNFPEMANIPKQFPH